MTAKRWQSEDSDLSITAICTMGLKTERSMVLQRNKRANLATDKEAGDTREKTQRLRDWNRLLGNVKYANMTRQPKQFLNIGKSLKVGVVVVCVFVCVCVCICTYVYMLLHVERANKPSDVSSGCHNSVLGHGCHTTHSLSISSKIIHL